MPWPSHDHNNDVHDKAMSENFIRTFEFNSTPIKNCTPNRMTQTFNHFKISTTVRSMGLSLTTQCQRCFLMKSPTLTACLTTRDEDKPSNNFPHSALSIVTYLTLVREWLAYLPKLSMSLLHSVHLTKSRYSTTLTSQTTRSPLIVHNELHHRQWEGSNAGQLTTYS